MVGSRLGGPRGWAGRRKGGAVSEHKAGPNQGIDQAAHKVRQTAGWAAIVFLGIIIFLDLPRIKVIGDFVTWIAWPATVLICAYLFRTPLHRFIGDIYEVKFPGGSVARKLHEEVGKSGAEAATAPEFSKGPTTNELVRAKVVEALVADSDPGIIRREARSLALEYERVRASMPPSDRRTGAMEVVLAQMRTIGRAAFPLRHELRVSYSPGERLMAIATLQVVRDYDLINWLVDRVEKELPFVSFQALVAIREALRDPAGVDHRGGLLDAVKRLHSIADSSGGFHGDNDRVVMLNNIDATTKRLTEPAGAART